MVAVIDLTSASSNMSAYFTSWVNGYSSDYGKFWDSDDGLTASPSSTETYEQWGSGSSGGKGVVMDGAMQYSRGNMTGDVDTITFGNGYAASDADGISVTSELTITADPSYNLSSQDLLDLAIYDLSVNESTGYLFDYLAAVGTEINDTSASDVLIGFGGSDTFVFTSGNDQVTSAGTGTYGYQDGTDTLDVSAWGATSISDLTITQFGSDTSVEYDGSHSVYLTSVTATALDASDFIFA